MLTDELKSMRSRIITIVTILLGAVVIPCGIAAEPITGEAFDSLMAAQDTSCQWEFEKVFAGAVGCFVTGPLDPLLLDSSDPTSVLFSTPRVVFSSISRYEELWMRIPDRKDSVRFAKSPRMVQVAEVAGNRLGMFIEVMCDGEWKLVQLCTVHHVRHLVWLRNAVENGWFDLNEQDRIGYSKHIYRYFKWREFSRNMYINATEFDGDKTPPLAAKYNLPEQFDLLAEPPDYVIQGYQNYKDYLHTHAELTTEFASGITAFVPTVATLDWMKSNAPREAHPNKEAAKLQEEYEEFFERAGGDPRMMSTLTTNGFDTLRSGEYFFAVGLNGTIRFGREIPREEVERFEREKRRKVPRANHAFLFPGEPVLTAGAFFIDERTDQKLVKVNAQSGHYFYSNISETIREDIAVLSDHYLLTLGHFFIALDRLGIEYDGILISKL